jgi:DNA polymerase
MGRTNIVVYRGSPTSDLMIVGEGPGRVEDERGIAMVGPTGTYLVEILEEKGLTLKNYYITNVVLCRPPRNSDPTEVQMDACSRWLNWQIDKIQPKWIIAAGRIAYSRLNPKFILNKDKITRVEGEVVSPVHLRPIKVAAIQHPSAIKRSIFKEESYKKVIENILKQVRVDLVNI